MVWDAVIFDLGGVVLDWQPERAFEQVMPSELVPAFMERIGFHEWNRANDARDSLAEAEEELVRRFPSDAHGIRGYRRHFVHSVTAMVPGTSAVIAELAATGVTVSALTNWSGEMFALARPRFGVLGRFRDIVVSGREGMVKPDPAIYRLACARLGVEPSRAVFIDDSEANVAIARQVGLAGLAFTSPTQLRDDLAGLGLLGAREPLTVPTYHWAVRREWLHALDTGTWPWSGRGLGYDAEGFVHLSFDHQLARTRARFYADLEDDDVVLLRLDPAADLPIVVEDGFPHLFAPLPLDRVVQASAPA